jgi:hypothetical protein
LDACSAAGAAGTGGDKHPENAVRIKPRPMNKLFLVDFTGLKYIIFGAYISKAAKLKDIAPFTKIVYFE